VQAPTPLSSAPKASEPTPGEPVVIFQDVYLGFEDKEVLRGISFEIEARETKILLGESGSGKTLILKLAAGLIRPDSGKILVMGHDLSQMSEVELLDFRRTIGFVFQEGALFDSLDVDDNVAFRLREEHIPEEEIESRVREALRFVEMEQAIHKFPGELSGGMRRRVSIARALVDRPPIVFYDSPTAGLDPVTSQTIITLILRLRDTLGVTSVLATHRLQDAFGLANFRFDQKANRIEKLSPNGARAGIAPTNVLVLKGGEIYYRDSADNLLKSTDKYLKQFLASAE
jgi:phospholipid/cholesterol/gamma-HCH transport system ATP-binding protein